MNNFQQLLDQIVDEAIPQLNAIGEKQFNYKASPEKWSKKEILGHLIDSAYNNHQRFIRAENRPNLVFDGYDQVAWVKRNVYQDRNAKDIITCWQTTNQHLAYMIGNLSEQVLNRKMDHHNFHQIGMRPVLPTDAITLAYMIEDYIFHIEHHLSQILENYEWLSAK